MIRAGAANWLSAPVTRPTHYVGRVGALAVALGIGGALAGMPAAAADTGAETSDAATGSSAGSSQSRADTARSPRTARRGGAPGGETPNAAPNAAVSTEGSRTGAAAGDDSDAGSGTGNRRNTRGSTRVGDPGTAAQRDAVTPVDLPEQGVPEPAGTGAQSATRASVDVPSAPAEASPAAAVETPAALASQIEVAVSAAGADVPVMTAAVSQAGVAIVDPLEWLAGRGGTDVPAAAPLVWAAAAVSRRELAAPAPAIAPAASVSLGQTEDPQTWLSDRIAGIDFLAGLPEVIRVGFADAAAGWLGETFGASALADAASLIAVLEGGFSGTAAIAAVGDAVAGWWDGADVADRISALAASAVDDFLSAPGVSEALAVAAEAVATAASPAGALAGAVGTLLDSDAVRDAVGSAVSGVLNSLVSEADDIVGELGGTVAGWVAGLTGSEEIGAAVAGQLVGLATSVLPDAAGIGPVADAVTQWWAGADFSGWLDGLDGTPLGSVASDLLTAPGVVEVLAAVAAQVADAADPVAALPGAFQTAFGADAVRDAIDATLSQALGDLAPVVASLTDWAGAVLPGLLDQPGLTGALTGIAGDFAFAVLTGADPGDALSAAWGSLQSDPAVGTAVGAAVSAAVGALLGDAELLQTASTVISGILGAVVDDAELVASVAEALPGFLGQPGVADTLAGVAGEFAAALLTGADLGQAATAALGALQSDPGVQAALAAVMSGTVGGLLSNPEVVLYVRTAVSSVVTGLVGDAELAAQTADQLVPLAFSVLADGPAAVDDFQDAITALLEDWIVTADPGSAELAPALAAAGFAVLRAGLLGDFSAVPSAIQGLASDTAVLAGLAERIAGIGLAAGLPAEVQTAIGEAATALISQSLGDSAVAEALSTVFEAINFPSGATEVSDFLNELVGSGFDVQAVVLGLLGPDLPAALGSFLSDPEVLQALGTATADAVGILASAVLEQGSLGAIAGMGEALSGLLSDAAGAALVGFLSEPGIGDVLATSAVNAILTALGADPLPVGGDTPATLELAVTGAITALLSDPGLSGTLESAAADLISALAGDPALRAVLGAQISALVVSFVDDGATAADLGPALSDAVLALLADPAVADGLGAVAGSVLTGILGQQDAVAALAGIAGDVVTALVTGSDPADAISLALDALQSDPALLAALGATISAVLDTVDTELLGDAAVQEAIGTAAGALLAGLADNPTIRALIDAQLGAALGPSFSGVIDEVLAIGGPLVTDLLGYPGMSSALTGAADQLATAVLAGADLQTALQDALSALQSDPAVQGALGALIPQLLDLVGEAEEIRAGIGEAAQEVVSDLLAQAGLDPATSSALGQVADVAISSLLGNPAVGNLIGDIAVDLLDGSATEEIIDTVIDSVLRNPALQGAVGTAIGQGIGSLFGDNVIGAVVGGVAGAAATLLIGLFAGVTLLFGRPSLSAAAAEGLLDPAAAMVVTITVPDWQELAAAV